MAALAVSAVTTAVATAGLRRRPPGGATRWSRTNHRGEIVTLLEGPALALGVLVALAVPVAPPHVRAAAAVAVTGAAAVGAYDDLAGDAGSKGLAGHLRALRHGRVTTGAVKVAGLAATGVAAALLVDVERTPPGRAGAGRRTPPGSRAVDALVGGAVVAGTANLVNLLDLRPGRALKVSLLVAALVPGAGAPLAAVAAGGALTSLPDDLAERAMLGDTGANAAGALLGAAVLAATAPRSRIAVLAAVTALTLASERVSFTAVIESTPVLRSLDGLGRRAAAQP